MQIFKCSEEKNNLCKCSAGELNSLEFEMRVAINQLLHRAQVVSLASADEAFQGCNELILQRVYITQD